MLLTINSHWVFDQEWKTFIFVGRSWMKGGAVDFEHSFDQWYVNKGACIVKDPATL